MFYNKIKGKNMAKEKLSCENCGSALTKIENDDKTYICLHCGTKVVVEPDINQTVNNYQVEQNITKHIYGKEKLEYEELIYKAETFIKLENYSKALNYIEQAINENPGNFGAWWVSAKAKLLKGIEKANKSTTIFGLMLDESFVKDYDNAMKLAPEDKKQEITNEYTELKVKFYEVNKGSGQMSFGRNYVPANNEQCPLPNHVTALKILVVLGFVIIALGIFLATAFSMPALVALGGYGVIFMLIGISIKRNASENAKVIKYIQQFNKITVKEVAEHFGVAYEVIVTQKIFDNKIKDFIINGWLCGYEYNNGVLTKVKVN